MGKSAKTSNQAVSTVTYPAQESSTVSPSAGASSYVDYDNSYIDESSSYSEEETYSGTESSYNSNADRVPYTPSQIVGRRLLAKQPLHAYVNIYIGDKLLSTDPAKPNTIQSFEIDRQDGAGDNARFVLFDDSWEEIEKIFSDHWDDVNIEYGYVDSSLVSPTYQMMLSDYSISFNSTGVILSVSAISQGTVKNLQSLSVATESNNPTEAAKMICEAAGYTVLDENFEATEDVEDTFNMFNDYPATYIINEILPTAVNSSGDYMHFNIDSSGVAYFQSSPFTSSSTDSDTPTIKTYIYQKGYDGIVKDLTFDIKGVFGGTTIYRLASGVSSVFIDSTTKEISSYTETTKTATASLTATGEYQHMSADQSIPNVDPSGYTESQVKHRLSYYLKRNVTEMYEATMTIVGDPTINLLDDIRIINVTDAGYLHHTSGIYMVNQIIDSISEGEMITTLKLIRNGDINEGVELVNPRDLIK